MINLDAIYAKMMEMEECSGKRLRTVYVNDSVLQGMYKESLNFADKGVYIEECLDGLLVEVDNSLSNDDFKIKDGI